MLPWESPNRSLFQIAVAIGCCLCESAASIILSLIQSLWKVLQLAAKMNTSKEWDELQGFDGEVKIIESVEGVYISSPDQLHDMERLSKRLQKVFASRNEQELEFVEGDLVVVDNKEGAYFRAEVMDIFKEFGTYDRGILHLKLIDLADNNYIAESLNCAHYPDLMKEETRPLFNKFKLHLKDLHLHEFTELDRDDLTGKLKSILRIGDKVRVNFAGFPQKGFLPEIIISKKGNCGELVVINDLLKQLKNQKMFTSTPLLKSLADAENVNKAVTGYDPKDASRVCAIFQKQGSCKRNFCSKDHEKMNPDGWTSDKELVFTDAFNTLNLDDVPIRSDLVILVTSTTDDCYNRFYGQILNLVEQDLHFGSLTKLEKLMANLASESKFVPLQVLPALGQLLVVQHSGMYYRGRVVGTVEDESSSRILVFCVDYGFEKLIGLDSSWDIHPNLLHLPFQAIQFFHLDTGFSSIQLGSKIDATFLGVDADFNVEIRLIDA